MSGIRQSKFLINEVPEPKIAKIVKSVKVSSPPSQPTGRKNGEQLISKNV